MYNHLKNICRLFHILPQQSSLNITERELDYYHQKVNIQVASRVAEQLKTWHQRKLGNFPWILICLDIMRKYSAVHPKSKFRHLFYKIAKNQL